MTHVDIYRRLSAFDAKSFFWMIGTFVGVVALLFVAISFVPQRWLDDYIDISDQPIMIMEPAEGARFLLVPLSLTSTLLIFSLVVGIITAAEGRSYLGAGATRRAIWLDGRRTNAIMAGVFLLIAAVTVTVAVLLDGGAQGADGTDLLLSAAGLLLALLASFEIGYVVALFFTRFHWLPGLIMCLAYAALLVAALSAGDRDAWMAIVGVGALTAFALAGSYRMMTTLPIRRSS